MSDEPKIHKCDMAAALEIAARFNPRKMPWIAVVIAKHMEPSRECLNKFTPTSENINALPKALRSFIHQLETRADPAGDVAARIVAQENCEAALHRIEELENI